MVMTGVTVTLSEYHGPAEQRAPGRSPWWRPWERQPVPPLLPVYLTARDRDDVILVKAALDERRARLERAALQKSRAKKHGR